MGECVLECSNIGKQYHLGENSDIFTFTEFLGSFFKTSHEKKADSSFWALKDVSFKINRGDVLGIVGKNGSGKSTLLKILSRITPPTQGSFGYNGTMASLLEVGTGFKQELSGYDNIFLSGTTLGLKHAEIAKQIDEIIDFAEIEKFINTPVKRYSSGMYVRLAFAVAAHLNPDILLLDEVLAVGDQKFQRKCLSKMGTVAKEGKTVLFVSHNMQAVTQLCNKAILLNKGNLLSEGSVHDIVKTYQELNENVTARSKPILFDKKSDSEAQFLNITLSHQNQIKNSFDILETIKLSVEYNVNKTFEDLHILFSISTLDGMIVYSSREQDYYNSMNNKKRQFSPKKTGNYKFSADLPAPHLNCGFYELKVFLISDLEHIIDRYDGIQFEIHDYESSFSSFVSKKTAHGITAPIIPSETKAD